MFKGLPSFVVVVVVVVVIAVDLVKLVQPVDPGKLFTIFISAF